MDINIRATVEKIVSSKGKEHYNPKEFESFIKKYPKLFELTQTDAFDMNILDLMLSEASKQKEKVEKDMDVSLALADRFVYDNCILSRPSDETLKNTRQFLLNKFR